MTKPTRAAVLSAGLVCAGLLAPLPSHAADPVTLTLKSHKFTPDQVSSQWRS